MRRLVCGRSGRWLGRLGYGRGCVVGLTTWCLSAAEKFFLCEERITRLGQRRSCPRILVMPQGRGRSGRRKGLGWLGW